MRTAVVIPARLAATRLPKKPLADLGGLPLVVQTARVAQRSQAQWVVVATDSEEIMSACRQHGVDAVLTDTAHQSGSDRVAEVVLSHAMDHVINLQADEPFVSVDDLDAIFAALHGANRAVVTLRTPIVSESELHDVHCVKVVCRNDMQALYFSRAPIPFLRPDLAPKAQAYRHLGVYGYTRQALLTLTKSSPHPLELHEGLEQLRALAIGLPILLLDSQQPGMGIDTPEDLERARQHLQTIAKKH